MPKRVFFCFHASDVRSSRAHAIRDHWLSVQGNEAAGFFDPLLWEETKGQGKPAIKRLIDNGLEGTSATCVLVGSETHASPWVRYEVFKSIHRGNRLFAVHINGIPDTDGQTKNPGPNPFESLGFQYSKDGWSLNLYERVNNVWTEYKEINNSSKYGLRDIVSEDRRGKFFPLSKFYPIYMWNEQSGVTDFNKWVEDNPY
jgi:hypothetical protein